ncbi:ATP-dependent Clp protease adaptor protein ClpS [Neorhodopirellula lusitana]|uniref:ATP-dependent Clp protease adaptor protein ClpS n=1 Tax=Neorhodopirellula lusitana TaxID=445327 RepID=A0ABY1Q3S9_9BACT|nr:ATP-dependent Clp protease adaptor ClpS [Neorhodopirellula lusitana]SMP57000.1 ATP-dependent Clp protease adaptor protein ClpS [Neorhodopirellula lusitana]
MSDEQSIFDEVVTVAVAEPETEQRRRNDPKPKKQPPYHVILWDDADHSYEYVVLMMKRLFRMPIEKGFQVAKEVDRSGRAICMTTTMELAELKRDQIHAFGKDELLSRCKGSMSATIEPAEG